MGPLRKALKTAIIAALVTFGLAFPIVALKTEPDDQNHLMLQQRWGLVAVALRHRLRRRAAALVSESPRDSGRKAPRRPLLSADHKLRRKYHRAHWPRASDRLPVHRRGAGGHLGLDQMDRKLRRADPALYPARPGASTSWSGSRDFWTSAMWPSTRWAPIHRRFSPRRSISRSG